MTNYLILEVNNYIERFIVKCIKNNISLYEVNYLSSEKIIVKINYTDYKRIKKLNYYSKIRIIHYEGMHYIKNHLKNNLYVYLIVMFCFLLMDIITSYIVKVEVLHENSQVIKLIYNELDKHNLKKYTLAKSFEELDSIRKKIVKENPTNLEWISITKVGMSYVIRVEERIIIKKEEETGYRHIISTKDALITKVISSKGEIIVRSGDYVKKGDILISGHIKLYDNIKGNTLATGSVYGNVWYSAEISYPLTKEEINLTGKKRTNININNRIVLKNKYQYFSQENIRELNILGIKIKIYEEVEYLKNIKVLSSQEAEKEALKKIKEEFIIKLKEKGNVISQKVLKKVENNSTIDMRVFVVTNELISDDLYYEIGSDIIDT